MPLYKRVIELSPLRSVTRWLQLASFGGYAVRACTQQRSWRYTKDIDFIKIRRDLTGLHGVLELLEFSFEETDFGVKGSKKINDDSIKLHISVYKVIDWSTGLKYTLP
jgi:predicted nucleotidyltransferase component of viral defense system